MNHRCIFFGSSPFSVIVLNELAAAGIVPVAVVTAPDSKKGRGLVLTPSAVKTWATEKGVAVLTPSTLKDEAVVRELADLSARESVNVFVTASYGKIIPESILAIPARGTLNVHPSLLPKLRGPSPIESAILTEEKTGVSIMLVDKEVDHGDVVSQKEVAITNWPPYAEELETTLAHEGGRMLAEILPRWVAGAVDAHPQNHSAATFTKKLRGEDGLIDLSDDPARNLRKIRAFHISPGAYFFAEKKDGTKIRVRIKTAHIENNTLVLERVVPEGKKEMLYEDFKRGFH